MDTPDSNDGSKQLPIAAEQNSEGQYAALQLAPEEISPLQLYRSYASPSELIVPYRLVPNARSLAGAWIESRYQGPIFNMDFPWIVTMGAALLLTAFVAIVHSGCTILGINPGHLTDLLFLSAAFPLFFIMFSPIIYPILVGLNLSTAYKSRWLSSLVGPTHIGVTDSGFKLYWRGQWFYCYPMLALWTEIFEIDLVDEEKYPLPSLEFVYQTGFGRRKTTIPLIGFQSVDDLHLVLSSVARWVPKENQGPKLRRMSRKDFLELKEQFNEIAGSFPSALESQQSKLVSLPETEKESSKD